jgi:hypothetical protein
VEDALLRARDALAYAAYGADYTCQAPRIQARINQQVQITWDAIRVHLQGISEPLRPSERLALRPERRSTRQGE